jgi:hypothetical protein
MNIMDWMLSGLFKFSFVILNVQLWAIKVIVNRHFGINYMMISYKKGCHERQNIEKKRCASNLVLE